MTNNQHANFSRYIRNFWLIYGISAFFILLLFITTSFGWLGFMPTFEELENPKSNLASEVYSSDQVLLGKYILKTAQLVIIVNCLPTW